MTATAAAAVSDQDARVRPAAVYWPAQALAVVVFAVYTVYALSRQATVLTAGYDLGIFDQAVRDYSRLRAPIVELKGAGYNIFADHFHPVIAVVAPLYWVWDSPSVLLVVQSALIAASVPVVHRFAARRVGDRGALAVAFGYALGWAVQAMVDFDFHEIAFGVPLLAVAVDALDRRDDRALVVACALLMLTREDMGAVLVVLGLLRLRRRPRAVPVTLIAVGVTGYLVATSLVIPHFAPGGRFAYWTFDALGPNLPRSLLAIVEHPLRTVRLLVSPSVKAQTWAYLLVPWLLLSLRSPLILVAAPLLAERFFNSRDYLWTTHYHYNVLPWVVLAMAAVDGGQRLGVWRSARWRGPALTFVAAVPLVLLIWPGPTPAPIRRMITGEAFHTTAHTRDQQAAVRQVPRNVCISVDDRLAPQLTNRNRTTEPGLTTTRTDLVVLDMSQKDVGY
ncbi:MAG: DUF2079 domain-containing protein, partial [bacterium]